MPTSYSPINGWALLGLPPRGSVGYGTVSAVTLDGDVEIVLQEFVRRYAQRVEPIVTLFGWRSAAENARVGGDPGSAHITGTALDINGGRHPWEKRDPKRWSSGFSAEQISSIRTIIGELGGILRWGMDYGSGYRDPMHFHISASSAQVKAVANRLQAKPVPTPLPAPPAPPPAADSAGPNEETEMSSFITEALTDAYRKECGRDPDEIGLRERRLRIALNLSTLADEINDIDRSLESNRFFVIGLYRDLLNRVPESMSVVDEKIASVGGGDVDSGAKAQSIIDSIKASPEYKNLHG